MALTGWLRILAQRTKQPRWLFEAGDSEPKVREWRRVYQSEGPGWTSIRGAEPVSGASGSNHKGKLMFTIRDLWLVVEILFRFPAAERNYTVPPVPTTSFLKGDGHVSHQDTD